MNENFETAATSTRRKEDKETIETNNTRATPEELTEIMTEKLMDPTIVERYGTSLKMSMGREYSKFLKERFEKLKKEFSTIDKNSDDILDFQELYEFFTSYSDTTNLEITKEYIEDLYEFIDHNKDNAISVQEFILSYMVIEEKIRHKEMHLKQVIDEYSLLENKNEIANKEGVSNNAELMITVLNAENLPESYGMESKPYVVVKYLGKELVSHYKQTINPIWNEDFNL